MFCSVVTATQNVTTGYSLQKERRYGLHRLNSMRRRARREAKRVPAACRGHFGRNKRFALLSAILFSSLGSLIKLIGSTCPASLNSTVARAFSVLFPSPLSLAIQPIGYGTKSQQLIGYISFLLSCLVFFTVIFTMV